MSDYFLSIEFIIMNSDYHFWWNHLNYMDELAHEENQ